MKTKRFAQIITCLLLVVVLAVPFMGCTKPDRIYDNEKDPFIYATSELDGLFSPFFSTSAYDGEIAGLTQVSMLETDEEGNIVAGDEYPCVVKDFYYEVTDTRVGEKNNEDYDSDEYYTTYEFVIKNGILFSDGVELTIEDVLFNFYVYLDPVYTGSNTMYSTAIKGLLPYQSQIPGMTDLREWENRFTTEARVRRKAVLDYYPPEGGHIANSSYPEEVVKADAVKIGQLFEEELKSDWNNFAASLDDMADEYKDKNGKILITETWQLFLLLEGLVSPTYDTYGPDPTKIVSIDFRVWASDVAAEKQKAGAEGADEAVKDFCIQAAWDNYYGTEQDIRNNLQSILSSWNTANTYLTYVINELKSAEFRKIEEAGEGVPNVSGITTYTTSSFRGTNYTETHDVLRIEIGGVDPKAIYNFGVTIAPMHYYSDTTGSAFNENQGWKGFSITNNHFGFVFGDSNYMNNVIGGKNKLPMGAGPYKMTNEKSEEDITKITERGVNGFFNNNIVYFVRNDNYGRTAKSERIHAPLIKYLRYSVTNSNRLLDAVKTREVHYSNPSAKESVMNDLTKVKRDKDVQYIAQPNNGYGYIGINARYVADQRIRQAIMFACNTSLVLDYYPANMAENIYRPMSKESWAYPKDISVPYYNNRDASGKFSEKIAKEAIEGLLADAGYTAKNSDKVLYKEETIGGQRYLRTLKFTFTIAGADMNDHPAYNTLNRAANILNQLGFSCTVKPDLRALNKIATGQLEVWAAAWSSAIDPDMYQVYHKESKATSINAWGYNYLLGLGGLTGYATQDEKDIIDDLSILIDQGRSILEQETKDGVRGRKAIYRDALDLIMELAVELPTYQRKNIYVYRSSIVDESSLFGKLEVTAYKSPLSEIWRLSFANQDKLVKEGL